MKRRTRRVIDYIVDSTVVRKTLVVGWYVLGIYATYLAAFFVRFEGHVPLVAMAECLHTLPALLIVMLGVFWIFRLFSGMWSYFSIYDLVRLGAGLAVSIVVFALMIFFFRSMSFGGYPRSVFVLEFLLLGFWLAGSRVLARYIRERTYGVVSDIEGVERLLIIGNAEDLDVLLKSSQLRMIGSVIGVVTDNPSHVGMRLHGISVYGPISTLGNLAKKMKPTSVLVLPPFNKPAELSGIVDDCVKAGVACSFRMVPSLAELARGDFVISKIKKIEIDDLLGRDVQHFDRTEIRGFIKGKRIMVTGAGGSIGQELARQISFYEPAVLLLFDISEASLFNVDRKLSGLATGFKIIPYVGDVRNQGDVRFAMEKAGGIDVVYHAAAYKHVSLMEINEPAAFSVNVIGTRVLKDVAVDKGVDRVVLVSTDKAVRPSSLMGATKRLAERIVTEGDYGRTTCLAVRFGNVLGSSGSVVPIFQEQIGKGGPVTVASPEVERYFMTIPEACDLVLLAGCIGRNRDIMVLEMGKPVKIVDLARKMIELAGLVPEKDIKIEYTGLRQGEKISEELFADGECISKTANDQISVIRRANPASAEAMSMDINEIARLVELHDHDGLRKMALLFNP